MEATNNQHEYEDDVFFMAQIHFHFEEDECKVSLKSTWSDHSIQRAFSVHWSFVSRLLVLGHLVIFTTIGYWR